MSVKAQVNSHVEFECMLRYFFQINKESNKTTCSLSEINKWLSNVNPLSFPEVMHDDLCAVLAIPMVFVMILLYSSSNYVDCKCIDEYPKVKCKLKNSTM